MGNYANLKKKDLLGIVADSVDRFLGKFKQKHGLADKFRSKALANEIGELRARLRNGKQDTNSLSTDYPPEKEENQETNPANDAG